MKIKEFRKLIINFLIIGIDNVKKQIEAELLIEGFKNLHLSRIYL